VFVVNQHGKPLMPCCARKARLLLKQKQARVVRRTPFTIQLTAKGVSRFYKREMNLAKAFSLRIQWGCRPPLNPRAKRVAFLYGSSGYRQSIDQGVDAGYNNFCSLSRAAPMAAW
jgi:hypothetical protein